ncbi:hypothetical protein BGZ75_006798 [Mortierella antarctica]|nr:hypothetical protein BGZ67_005025 [Mortierella alpina]KAF9981838.1 hypothetical protein BGZ75_006798 [Mortierella antarctica]
MTVLQYQTSQRKTIDLGDGLIMRWSTHADTENVGNLIADAFRWVPLGNPHFPRDRVPDDNEVMRAASRRLLSGKSPVMTEYDYALVEDTKREKGFNPIVACVSLHQDRAYYGSVDVTFGKPELIATDPAYRNRGLVRKLMVQMVHPESEARGDILQFIPGIQYFYRQFGYEYGLNLGAGSTIETADAITPLGKDESEPYILRKATEEDIPFLVRMSTPEKMHSNAAVGLYYTREYWQYTVVTAPAEKQFPLDVDRDTRIIVHAATQKPIGFTVSSHAFLGPRLEAMALDENEVSYFDAADSLLRQLVANAKEFVGEQTKGLAEYTKKISETSASAKTETKVAEEPKAAEESKAAEETKTADEEAKGESEPEEFMPFGLNLHRRHPFGALLALSGKAKPPSDKKPCYRLYTRIGNYATFILAVKPELEKRLANSVLSGVTGTLRLDFFRKVEGQSGKGLEVVFEKGKIVEAKDWSKPDDEGQMLERVGWMKSGKMPNLYLATFHPLTFTNLVTGLRSVEDLVWAHGENAVRDDATTLLLNTLFPKVDHHFDIFHW